MGHHPLPLTLCLAGGRGKRKDGQIRNKGEYGDREDNCFPLYCFASWEGDKITLRHGVWY